MDAGEFSLDLKADIRDDFGRFTAHCEEAARRSAEEAADAAARAARDMAPSKSGRMRSTIRARTTYVTERSSTLTAEAEFSVSTNHWAYQEYGTRPHPITGDVLFFWENRNRYFTPGYNTIWHPGNRAVHFMEFGFEVGKEELKRAVRRNY